MRQRVASGIMAVVFLVAAVAAPAWAAGSWGGPVYAQDDAEIAECTVEFEDGTGEPFDGTFEACADAIGVMLVDTQVAEGYAFWGVLRIRAELEGNVWYTDTPNDPNAEWIYWGNWRLTMEELLDLVARDLDVFWSQTFEQGGQVYRAPENITTYNMRVSTGCGAAPTWNAFYCSRDHSIYLDRNLLAREYKSYGDFAPATILAHEWAHAMQANLGLLQGQYFTINIELQADCFAGAWARWAGSESTLIVLEPGDVDEGAESLFLKGDDLPWFDPRAHGTGEQRYASFFKGYQFGLASCLLGALTTDEVDIEN